MAGGQFVPSPPPDILGLIGTSNHYFMQTDMVLLLLIENNTKGSLKSMLYEISNDETRFNYLEQIKGLSR